MSDAIFILDPESRFGRHFNERRAFSVIAAAISKRWSLPEIADAYGMHPRTVGYMRGGHRGKYRRAHQILGEIGEKQFIQLYLHDDDIARLDKIKDLRGNIRRRGGVDGRHR
jgi:hypothetical protein